MPGQIAPSRLAVLGSLVVMAACATVPGRSPDLRPMGADFAETGTRRFSFQDPNGTAVIDGWFNVTADTIVVRAEPGPCSYQPPAQLGYRVSTRRRHIYQCQDRTLSFDAERPVSEVYLTYLRTAFVTRRVCGNYENNAQGVRVCTKYELERVEQRSPVTVRLRPWVQ